MTECDNHHCFNSYHCFNNYCESCGEESEATFGCIKCGNIVCPSCIDGYISDWECVCKECEW